MKKSILGFIIMFITFTSFAQEDKKEKKPPKYTNYFGVRAGVNYSPMKITGATTKNTNISPNVGLYFESRQSNRLSFLIELNYSQRGGTIQNPNYQSTGFPPLVPDSVSTTTQYTVNYLDIPIMLTFYPTKNLSIGAGVAVSKVLKAKYKVTSMGGNDTISNNKETTFKPTADTPQESAFFPVSFTFVAGINYKITESLNIDVKYIPLTTFYHDGISGTKTTFSTLTFRIGYSFVKK